jgi:uncharacterized protein (DUF2336 family)
MKGLVRRMLGRAGIGADELTYEEARDLARHPDSKVRRELAARQDVRPEILYYLAVDASTEVRLEIAGNATTPAKADLILARDGDDGVRCELAGKIARLMPHLSEDAQHRLSDITIEVLEILARDQLSRVRQILSETLKDVAEVPAHVIRWLAHDIDLAVAAPVLQFSPLLTDNDLVEIIESAPVQGALAAISRRRGLSAGLCDAIVTTDDVKAIGDLLGNTSAQVREETLDYVVERAREITGWQGALVQRPRLPRGTIRKLAGFVTDSLLSVLSQRRDLPPDVLEEVAAVVRQRVETDGLPAGASKRGGKSKAADENGTLDHATLREKGTKLVQYVQKLHATGKLDEDAIDEALSLGSEEFVALALALRASVPLTMVSRVIAAHSAKGITALAWKAGLGMRFAVKLQMRVARVAPADVINAKDGTDYPLKPDEMNWLINFFSE